MEKAWDVIRIFIALGIIALIIAVPIVLCSGMYDIVNEVSTEQEIIDKVRQGEVVDKNIANNKEYTNKRYQANEPKYLITLKIEYVYGDDIKTTNVTKIVDKETYLSVNKGDIFDIETLSVVNKASATDAKKGE